MAEHGLNLLFTGDYYSYPELSEYCKNDVNSANIFHDLTPVLADIDVAGINIEFPITDKKAGIKKTGPNLKGAVNTLEPFKGTGFNLAYISNNHTLDYGYEGMLDNISNLKKYGFNVVGVGDDIKSAREPFYFKKNGVNCAILNFAENEFNIATENDGGANPLDIINNVKDIRLAKRNAQFVFVVVHAGQDFNHYPPPFLIKQLRFYAEEGASAIICHHSHYISGYEEHIGVPIFYGLGNLIYPRFVNIENNKTLVVKFNIKNGILTYEVLPYYFDSKSMRLFDASNDIGFAKQLDSLNKVIKNPKLLEEKWIERINFEEKYRYLMLIRGWPHVIFKIFKKMRILSLTDKYFRRNSQYNRVIINLIRRETHRDALLKIHKDLLDG